MRTIIISGFFAIIAVIYVYPQGGSSFETAVQASFDTNNIADAGETEQYYYFIPDFYGYAAIGNCGLTILNPDLMVYDSLEYHMDVNNYSCGFQTHVVIPVDSAMRYYIHWTNYENTELTFNWYLTEYYPEPGEFPEIAIPVEIDDTIELSSINNSLETWYKFEAEKNKMNTISSCGFGNGLYDILSIYVYQDTVKETYSADWMTWDNNCSDGKILDFPADSGSLYYIYLHHLSDVTSAKWTITERDFISGDICDSAIQADEGVTYVVPSEKNGLWYKYTPAENEYKVIGSVLAEEKFAYIYIKEDCDCEPEFSVASGCMAGTKSGIALPMEAGKTYYIGWDNFEYEEITWSMYDPTDVVYFTVTGQIEPTVIDHDNHTIEIKVNSGTSVTNLAANFVKADNIDFIVNSENQYSGSQQDFTNPVTYTVRYTDDENDVTLSQNWIVTVTKEESTSEPYAVKSDYLKNPDLAKPLVSDWADFWKSAYDTEHGGFFSYIDQEGNPTDEIKTIISQTQDAYAFARAFMVTGDTSYLGYANRALQFMYDYYWDETYDGWYVSVNADGSLNGSDTYNDNKYSFFQHYANVGMVAMADATAGSRFNNQEVSGTVFNEHEHWEMLNNSLDVINENLWDDREDYYGYYYEADLDWSNPHGKGFTPTVDGITLHGLYMYLLTKDSFFYTRLEQLTNNIEEHMIPEMESLDLGFPENYNSNWGEPSSLIFIGHMYKTAWCLARTYLVNPQERYREAGNVLMNDLLNNGGYDFVYGGPCFVNEVPVNKLFWEVEQAYTSGMMNYYISSDEDDKNRFLKVADGTIDFFMNHFVDTEYGEVYEMTDKEGNVTSSQKGHYDKAGYHSTELVYYTYLYGNLLYKKEPVELYYFIDASDETQTVSLYPLAIEDNYLKIDAVELDGVPFTSFNRDTRTLNIAANEGGIFKVTFSNTRPVSGLDEPLALSDNRVNMNIYPNPITTSGTIEYTIDTYTDITIHIFDLTGKVIYSVENKNVSPGTHQEIIRREDLQENNICLVQVKTNTQSNILKLLIMD